MGKNIEFNDAAWEKMVLWAKKVCMEQEEPYCWPAQNTSINYSRLGFKLPSETIPKNQNEAANVKRFLKFSTNFSKCNFIKNSNDFSTDDKEQIAIFEVLEWGGTVKDPGVEKNIIRDFKNGLVAIKNNKYNLNDDGGIKTIVRIGKKDDKDGNGGNMRIASWSKILAAYMPGKFFIYDSRVAIALSRIALENAIPCVWRIPEPKFSKRKDKDGEETIIGLKEEAFKKFKKKCQNNRKKAGFSKNGADIPTCYVLYLKLLEALANDPDIQTKYSMLAEDIKNAYHDALEDDKKAIMAHLEKQLFMLGGCLSQLPEEKQ